MYLNFSIFTAFLKNRNIISKMKRSKVTDYAALRLGKHTYFSKLFFFLEKLYNFMHFERHFAYQNA